MNNGDTLYGKVLKITEENTLFLKHAASTDLVEIEASAVDKLVMQQQVKKHPVAQPSQLALANGDVLPCSITNITAENVEISTWYGGKYSIPRTAVSSIRFGTTLPSQIFTTKDNRRLLKKNVGWQLKEGRYLSNIAANMHEQFKLPNDYLVRFKINWIKTPSFRINLSAPNTNIHEKNNRYQFQFNSQGFILTRVTRRRYERLAYIAKRPHNFRKQEVEVELRVSRTNGKVMLYVDGRLESTALDKSRKDKCVGNYIAIINEAHRTPLTISNFGVFSWDGRSSKSHVASPLNKASKDTLVDSKGRTFSGKLIGYTDTDNGKAIEFKIEHAEEPIKVPLKHAAILSIAGEKSVAFDEANASLFIGGGKLRLKGITLEEGVIKGSHPVLGDCTLQAKAFTYLELDESNKK